MLRQISKVITLFSIHSVDGSHRCSESQTSFQSATHPKQQTQYPIKPIEKLMFFQIIERSTQTIIWIVFIEQLADQIFRTFHQNMTCILHKLWKFQRICHNLIIYLFHVFCININEGIFASQKLIEDGTKRPKVSTVRIPFVRKYLGCHILRSSNKTESSILILEHPLTSAHINQFEISISPHHDIFRFQISIDDVFVMHYFQDVDEKGDIKTSLLDGQNPY